MCFQFIYEILPVLRNKLIIFKFIYHKDYLKKKINKLIKM